MRMSRMDAARTAAAKRSAVTVLLMVRCLLRVLKACTDERAGQKVPPLWIPGLRQPVPGKVVYQIGVFPSRNQGCGLRLGKAA